MLVKNWMTKDVITIEADQSMRDAIYVLEENRVNLLPVTLKGKVVGVLTDRDLKKASPSECSVREMKEFMELISKISVRDIMTGDPVTISPDYTVEEAAAILMEKRISGLPVLDENRKLVGIITRSDVFKMLTTLTGLGQRGLQIAVRLEDVPGAIEEVRRIISKYSGHATSIISSTEEAPQGYFNAYFRVYDLERKKLPQMLGEIEEKAVMLYVVDFREKKRTVYEAA
jgi:acetoin utilization protein AcuB